MNEKDDYPRDCYVWVKESAKGKEYMFCWDEAEEYKQLDELANRIMGLAIDLGLCGHPITVKYDKLLDCVSNIEFDINVMTSEDTRDITASSIFYRVPNSNEIAALKDEIFKIEHKTYDKFGMMIGEDDFKYKKEHLANRRKEKSI